MPGLNRFFTAANPLILIALLLGFAAQAVAQQPHSSRERTAQLLAQRTAPRGRPAQSAEEFLKRLPAGVKAELDIPYREGNPAWKLDLVMPAELGDKPRPGIVSIHGGGWAYGDKRRGAQNAVRYAQRGYVCISVNYRMTGEAPFPASVEDVKNAVRWFRAHATKYNVDPNRIGGSGHSAGAHLVAMLGVAGPNAGLEGDGPYQEQSSLLNAVATMATPTDFLNWHRPIAQQRSINALLAGPPETLDQRARQASPITYVNADAPPFLLIHGTRDGTVDVSQAKRFAAALEQAGAKQVEQMILEGASHTPSRDHPVEIRQRVEAFFDRTIGGDDVKPSQEETRASNKVRQPDRSAQRASSRQRPTPRNILDRVKANDKNGDGKITKEEASQMLLRFFDNWDTNGDGVIDQAELDARASGSPSGQP